MRFKYRCVDCIACHRIARATMGSAKCGHCGAAFTVPRRLGLRPRLQQHLWNAIKWPYSVLLTPLPRAKGARVPALLVKVHGWSATLTWIIPAILAVSVSVFLLIFGLFATLLSMSLESAFGDDPSGVGWSVAATFAGLLGIAILALLVFMLPGFLALAPSSVAYRAWAEARPRAKLKTFLATMWSTLMAGAILAYVILGYSTDELKQSPYVVIYGATAILMILTAWAMLISAVAAVPSRSQSVRPHWLDERRA